eukprot:4593124-Amphidinium_carterae.1
MHQESLGRELTGLGCQLRLVRKDALDQLQSFANPSRLDPPFFRLVLLLELEEQVPMRVVT